jgi:TPR repeat protein
MHSVPTSSRCLKLPLIVCAVLLSSVVAAADCPQCDVYRQWLEENAGPCGYHGNRLPSICQADPECVSWNQRCNSYRQQLSDCEARCAQEAARATTPLTAPAGSPTGVVSDGIGQRQGQSTGRHSREWCEEKRQEFIDRGFDRGSIGVVIAAMGDTKVEACEGGVFPMERGYQVMLGDSIITGSDGRARVQMRDRDEEHNAGPSVINVATNSAMQFTQFSTNFSLDRERGLIDLFRGTLRTFFKGWGGDSTVSIRTGVTVCGIRGSDVVVSYEPGAERVFTYVIDGHAELVNTSTGERRDLAAGQQVAVERGAIGQVRALTGSKSASLVSSHGLDLGEGEGEGSDLESACYSANDPIACTQLGVRYENGDGVPMDLGRALALYQRGCAGGCAAGCFNQALLYATGKGVAQDLATAAKLYQRGCEGGNALACTNLGVLYRDGRGVPRDDARAFAFCTQGCSGGNAVGCSNVGYLYETGRGVARSDDKAFEYYRQGCDGGDAVACGTLGWMHYQGRGIEANPTVARSLLQKACSQGNQWACDRLAQIGQ